MRSGGNGQGFDRYRWKRIGMVALLVIAPAVAGASAPDRRNWMPDVEQRVAELRQRTQASASEARERRARSTRTAEDWRRLAARPRPDRAATTPPLAERVR